ncbi:chemotaxis protein CheW [Sporosarcina sp. NCCP-2222]|uniref:chemotaxis protein CheW n=1 Tax=Sporosarcina TaxID=1569 RepID=UPI001EDF100D|nr:MULTISPECIES: chemotaxis protein CheW [Sporosarcina]MCG3090080.1 chemotaxis protein CheW [Sporosarcina cyprini]GKV55569.1 chemotaxis protein CheW [Sporosarcina sp. NCCP-2222]
MPELVGQDTVKSIVFQLLDKEYAMEVDVVEGIEKLMSITRVPKTPSYVKGVINLRGVVTPIVDLRERFGLETKEMDDNNRIIIVSLQDFEVGLIVDAANDVIDIPLRSIEPQPEVVGSVESEFISGVVKLDKRLLVMLNLDKVLQPLKRVSSDEY